MIPPAIRGEGGRFLPGQTGNRGGRPAATPAVPIDTAHWQRVLDDANEPVQILLPGYERRVTMTRLEACLDVLGSGSPRNRSALMAYVRLVRRAAWSIEAIAEDKRRRITEDDWEALERAAGTGDVDIWSVQVEAFFDKLPGPQDMTNRELMRALKRARAGKSREMPFGVEERLLSLVEKLNAAIEAG
ncbi:hypothetical protein [Sphingomonas montanisoli]|uniref:Uncharacterized protein n=1 Tax=Sphingomonas montanisoli TaxID=2606412 RepID=A0A5D9C2J5_9SPHN|nr:hypothetical protein [Sphingomonas montanisoli]TZG25806.1 hypothetical protein FYJ91_12500 [Sphingomonas montanisoli]